MIKLTKVTKYTKSSFVIISASPLWWWVSTERIGRAMIIIVIRPTLCCVFRVVRRCDHSNGAGNRLCPRGILLRRVRRGCGHRHIGALQVIPLTLKLRSFPVFDAPIWIPVFAAPPASTPTPTQASALTPALTPASPPVILLTVQFISLIVPVIVSPLAIFSFFSPVSFVHSTLNESSGD